MSSFNANYCSVARVEFLLFINEKWVNVRIGYFHEIGILRLYARNNIEQDFELKCELAKNSLWLSGFCKVLGIDFEGAASSELREYTENLMNLFKSGGG